MKRLIPLAGSIALLLPHAHGADIIKLQNPDALNVGTAWTGGVVPGANDIAVWDNTITGPLSSPLGGNLAWQGIRIGQVGGARNTTNNVTIANNSSNTLTLGTGGIDMSDAFQAAVIQSRLTFAGDQTWNIANANTATGIAGLNVGEDLSIVAQAVATPVNLGGFTLTKTGAGLVAFSSGHTISNGSVVVNAGTVHFQSGASRVATLDATLSLTANNGGTVQIAVQSAATNVNSPITLNTGGTLAVIPGQNNPLTLNGNITVAGNASLNVAPQLNAAQNASTVMTLNGNLLGSANLTYNNTLSTVTNFLRFAGNNSGYSGTLTMGATAGARILRLQNANSGSAAATWVLTAGNILQVDGVAVQLGTLNGAGSITNSSTTGAANVTIGAGNFSGSISNGTFATSLTKSTAGTLLLTGANTYTGTTQVNAGALIAAPGSLGATDVNVANGATFGARLLAADTTLAVQSINLGTSAGAKLSIDAGPFALSTIAPVFNAGAFNAVAGSTIQFAGSNLTPGTYPLVGYGSFGGGGFAGLSLLVPPRVIANLVDNSGASRVDLAITGLDFPKWTGAVNGDWDIDNGTGTGTANWKEVTNAGATRYLQTGSGSDKVLFDDTATGSTTVTLTATLTPSEINVNNTAKNYTFNGSGKLSGTGVLIKNGPGTLRIANTGANDYLGTTTINAGTVELGDGATAGAGNLTSSAITNNATLVFNRPDSFTMTVPITGTGGLVKNGAGTTTLSGNVVQAGPVALNAGGLVFAGGGNLSGAVSGPGTLTVSGGTLQLAGADANTQGATTVTGGRLELNKTGVNAVGGDITISGTGQVALLAPEQIPDTATINFIGSSADSFPGAQGGGETVANVIVNSSVPGNPGGQVIMRNGFNVAGTATVNSGILGVASGTSATVNAINITSPPGTNGIVRVAGSGGDSTLSVGAGGITASGGDIQVKFNTNAPIATLNLGGNYTATGDVTFTNGNYTGANASIVNLIGDGELGVGARTFSIAAGTTTTVRPLLSGPGGLTKTGNGTLDLLGNTSTFLENANYTGDTIVAAGTLRTDTRQLNTSSITVADGATLGIRALVPGGSLATPVVNLGSATGATVVFDLSGNGNPIVAPLTTTTLTTGGSNMLAVVGDVTPGQFPLIAYTDPIAGAGFAGLTLQLPLRVVGNLLNNPNSVDVDILGVDTPTWNGNLSNAWDIDNGGGTGTANWKGPVSNAALRYLQGAGGTDKVIFDDNATGTTTVNLTATLTPISVTVDNTAKDYTFIGTGRISGTTGLVKTGTGTLTIANTGNNDYTGATSIDAGTLIVGNGTAGVGTLGNGGVTITGALVLNRADDFNIFGALSGFGTLAKGQASTVTFSGVASYFGDITINAGALRFIGGGSLGGAISGAGALIADGGTLDLNGGLPNTYTGLTTVNSGTLRLSNFGGNAVGGDILIANTGVLTLLAPEQISDTATVTHTGSANSTLLNETLATIVVNTTGGAQLIANNGLVVTNAIILQNGVYSTASANSSTANGVIMSGGTLRVAANGGDSTFNVGAGGLVTSGGVIEVGQGVGAFNAVLNLGGDLMASADLNINRGGFTGDQLREINLTGGARTFDIVAGITNVLPDVRNGDLIKDGTGTLNLNGAQEYTSLTTNDGTTNLNRSLADATITDDGGTLNVNADASNSIIHANDGTVHLTVSQTLASLDIGAGGVVVLGAPAPAPEATLDAPAFVADSVQAVPEPGTLGLLAFGALALLRRRTK